MGDTKINHENVIQFEKLREDVKEEVSGEEIELLNLNQKISRVISEHLKESKISNSEVCATIIITALLFNMKKIFKILRAMGLTQELKSHIKSVKSILDSEI